MPPSDPARPPQDADSPLAAARKLVGLAVEQQHALELGAHEQFDWLVLRRQEATDRVNALVAAGIAVSPEEAAEITELREQLAAVDAAMEARVRVQLAEAGRRRRLFNRTKKSVTSYLTAGPRRTGFFDTKR